jgi:hypothetical protein
MNVEGNAPLFIGWVDQINTVKGKKTNTLLVIPRQTDPILEMGVLENLELKILPILEDIRNRKREILMRTQENGKRIKFTDEICGNSSPNYGDEEEGGTAGAGGFMSEGFSNKSCANSNNKFV